MTPVIATADKHCVLVVDDHPLFRKGVSQLLAMMPDIDATLEAGNGAEALALARQADPDLILLDLNLKGENGLDVLRALKEDDPARRVVMLTVSDAPDDLVAAIRAGADGYLLKDMEPEDLLARLREALSGSLVLGEALAAQLTLALRNEARDTRAGRNRHIGDLTERELAVLRCLAAGMSNKEIARALEITEGTVKVHVKHMLRKLSFRSRVEAAVWAADHGLRGPTPPGAA
ncbi:MAG TPA: two-component system response regulator NarL [Burkholderiaceae bacterium]|nr:two-component system response regulator NarL [Burkholderiaceae bacterium]